MENKRKWMGHPINNSDVGYEWDYEEEQISSGTTGPYNPVETDVTKENKEKAQ
jgi:hypothetical protein